MSLQDLYMYCWRGACGSTLVPTFFLHKATFLPAVFQHLMSRIKQNNFFPPLGD